MKVLVLNAGSSSLKYQLIDMKKETLIAKGLCDKVGDISKSTLSYKTNDFCRVIKTDMHDHKDALKAVLKMMLDEKIGVLKSVSEIYGVGHRVVHSAEDFTESVLVTDEVIRICIKNEELAPLHMPPSNYCIKACKTIMPNTPMVLVFDTAFHSTMPRKAYRYAISNADYKKYKVRKYGFHGTSHKYVSELACEALGNPNAKVITCHLGNGASMSAIKDGKCFDTSMGFTPLEGLVMGTRSGDMDPAVVSYLMGKKKMDVHEVIQYLNKECGLLGLSELSNDNRDLEAAAKAGNDKAQLALDVFDYRITKYIGAYAAVLGGIDAIVFTGGIGENSEYHRRVVLENLKFLGIQISDHKNSAQLESDVNDISADSASVKTFVINTNEELVIARDTKAIIERLKQL